MNIAHIMPGKLFSILEECKELQQVNLVLAHELEINKDYLDAVMSPLFQKSFIILDNGAYELGESISVERLIEIAKAINANAVVIPDSRFNTRKTLLLAQHAIPILRKELPHVKLLGVPQGNNDLSIWECFEELCELGVDGFGLYAEIGEVAGMQTRYEFLLTLQKRYSKEMLHQKYIHLLGMEEDLTQLKNQASLSWVNSNDSAKVIVCGLEGIHISSRGTYSEKYPRRPKDYFDLKEFTENQIHLIKENIENIRNFIKNP